MLVGLHASIENPTSTQTHLILAKEKHELFIAIILLVKTTSYNLSFFMFTHLYSYNQLSLTKTINDVHETPREV
jgi:hypothetical protein